MGAFDDDLFDDDRLFRNNWRLIGRFDFGTATHAEHVTRIKWGAASLAHRSSGNVGRRCRALFNDSFLDCSFDFRAATHAEDIAGV